MLEFWVQGFRVVLGSFKWRIEGMQGLQGLGSRFLRGFPEYKASEGSYRLYGKF